MYVVARRLFQVELFPVARLPEIEKELSIYNAVVDKMQTDDWHT
jgi:hypothetical protein